MQTRAISIVTAALFVSTAFAQQSDVLVRPETGEVIELDGPAQLEQVEPRIPLVPPPPDNPTPPMPTALLTITSPGSYYLTGNLNGGANFYGIDIQSSNVTLDLSGYSMVGLAGSLDAITSTTGGTNIIIANGTIRGWYGDGIDGRKINSAQIANVLVANCAGDGIAISRGLIEHCQARLCGGTGISVINGKGSVAECRAEECGSHGIVCGEMSATTGCSSTGNGLNGFIVGRGSTIEDCTGSQNHRDGIATLNHSTIRGCTALGNVRDGLRIGNKSVIAGCTANLNDGDGIGSGTGCNISGCIANDNGGVGIQGVDATVITGCTVAENTGVGIKTLGFGARVTDCRARDNDNSNAYQIEVENDSVVLNNAVDNGDLHVIGGYNRIDGNHVTDGSLVVDLGGNVIVRNSAANFTINGTNIVGLVRTTITGAGPWDNFDF